MTLAGPSHWTEGTRLLPHGGWASQTESGCPQANSSVSQAVTEHPHEHTSHLRSGNQKTNSPFRHRCARAMTIKWGQLLQTLQKRLWSQRQREVLRLTTQEGRPGAAFWRIAVLGASPTLGDTGRVAPPCCTVCSLTSHVVHRGTSRGAAILPSLFPTSLGMGSKCTEASRAPSTDKGCGQRPCFLGTDNEVEGLDRCPHGIRAPTRAGVACSTPFCPPLGLLQVTGSFSCL